MPYPNYGRMDKEDIYSMIAYIRSLAPIENEVPESKPDFPMNFIINTIPVKARTPGAACFFRRYCFWCVPGQCWPHVLNAHPG